MKISEILALREKKLKGEIEPQSKSKESTTSSKKTIRVLRTRETPNPNALQFVLNTQILDYGKKSYKSQEEAKEDPLALALFGVQGVDNVYIMENFVTLTKSETVPWESLKTSVWKLIDENVKVYPQSAKIESQNIDVKDFMNLPHSEKLSAIEMVLNRSIRSSLAQDGGGVDLIGLEGKEVQIHYQGACGNCPSSLTGTLQHIEKLVKQQLHQELVVKSVN